MTGKDLEKTIRIAANELISLRDELNELDAAMGDGDCGLTAEKGANGIIQFMNENPVANSEDLGKWLMQLGMSYNKAAPSTMGALMATAFMRAAREIKGKSEFDENDIAKMLTAASSGIQERGKAKPGDKTIVDAIEPAAQALSKSIGDGKSLKEAAAQALEAAKKGRDNAIPLRSNIGRGNWVGERSIGKLDPGTVLFVSVLEAVVRDFQ